ncbi:unnamed protein product [Rotaria sordida]|uniref:Uncharacterized protein n=1 Tax=Rotaria sordida TaxID=392033 RepID=A0A815QYA5_9BILA|nr:unnamed protein product [Rotaria sordida]
MQITETTSGTINGNDCIELTLSQGTNATSSQLTLSNQLYRQVKIDEENRLTHGGELAENATESENKDNDNDVRVEKNKKYSPYRALNIDLNEKSIQSIPTPSPLTSQLKESVPKQTETTSGTINGNDCIELTLPQGTNATSSQLTLSDQLYRQTKIDEENRLTRDGESPENATESGNKGNDNDVRVEKNKKYDLYRALNIDLNEKSIQSIPTPSPLTSQLKESVPKQKIIEKQEQSSTSKSKHKRERSDDKELLSPADQEENRPTSSTPSPAPPTTAEKTKVKKSSSATTTIVYTNTSVPLLLDIMTDDIHPTNQSEQQYNEQGTYKLAGQSNNLTIVNSIIILV